MDKTELFTFLSINAIDKWTLGVALFVVASKIAHRRYLGLNPYITRNACISDLLNGAVIVPFLVMVLNVFSPQTMAAYHTGPLLNGLAGGIGLIFVMGELLAVPGEPK